MTNPVPPDVWGRPHILALFEATSSDTEHSHPRGAFPRPRSRESVKGTATVRPGDIVNAGSEQMAHAAQAGSSAIAPIASEDLARSSRPDEVSQCKTE